MTHLLNLPKELLLLIAAELEFVDRRRLSKTCQPCFYLIRDPRNKERFDIKGEPVEMKIHQITDNVCVLRIGAYDLGLGNKDLKAHDAHVFIMISAKLDPGELSEILGDRARTWKVVRSRNALDKTIRMASEGSEHFNVSRITYEAHFERFNAGVAEKLMEISLACDFVIYNDGFYQESVHKLIENLLTAYLKVADQPWNTHLNRQLTVSEKFTRKCCSSNDDERSRIDGSSRRLLERLRDRERANAQEDRILQLYGFGWSSERQLFVEFDGDHIRVARIFSAGLDMYGASPCPFFYQQISPPYSVAMRTHQLLWMKEKAAGQTQKIQKLRELEQQLEGQQTMGIYLFPEMTILLKKTKKLRRKAQKKLLERKERIVLFEQPKGVVHRQ